MFSMPPPMAQSMKPAMISAAALAIPWAPEPHTRFTVIAGTDTGRPAWIAAWRAGFILLPAWMTLPMTTESMRSGVSPARFTTSRRTAAPSSAAGTPFSAPL